jgi:predicted nucleic acid-binding Zn ribbon protein
MTTEPPRAGEPGTPPAGDSDAATAAIRRARAAAKASGANKQPSLGKRTHYSGVGEARSGSGPDERDPQLLGRSVQRFIDAQGWDSATAVAALSGRWPEIVGPDIAEHVVVETFDPDQHLLVLRADSNAWASNLRLLSGQMIMRLAAELGPDVVRTLKIQGPAQPSRKGQWRVRGGRPDPD